MTFSQATPTGSGASLLIPALNLTVGTAGHVDHGKTSLVRNLTGCDTDSLKEEKERGMSIDLGFAPFAHRGLEVGIVDVPGHESFIRTMVAGATGIYCVLFVVAADDGVMPQTREHLDILALLGLRNGLIAMTKSDRVSPERLQEAEQQIRAQVAGTFLAGAPIVPVSNITGDGLLDLRERLAEILPTISPRDTGGPFRLPVDRSFAVKGFGTVVTGIPVSGSASIGDELQLVRQSNPVPESGRLRSVQVYQKQADTALAGQCAALNVPQWKHSGIRRGDAVVAPGFFSPHEWILCRLRVLLADRNQLRNGERIRFHAGTSDVTGSVYLLEGGRLGAGEEGVVQIRLDTALVLGPRDRFIVRSQTPPRTVAGGQVLEGLKRRLKRTLEETLTYAAEKAEAVNAPARSVELAIRRSGMTGAAVDELSRNTTLLPEEVAACLGQLKAGTVVVELGNGAFVHRETVDEAAAALVQALENYHRQEPLSSGATRPKLIEFAVVAAGCFEAAIAALIAQGRVAFNETTRRFAMASWKPQLPEAVAALCEQLESIFKQRLFNPLSVSEAGLELGARERDLQQAIKALKDSGRLVEVPEGILFHADAVAEAAAIAVRHFESEDRLESVKFKYLLNTTRKYALPMLDHLDAIGVTRRAGNTRFLKTRTAK